MQDLHIKRDGLIKQLNQAIEVKKKRGILKAETEKHYRVALAREELIRRSEGFPTTIISDICRGKEDIADLKMYRDIAISNYETIQEKIMAIKLEIRIVENEIEAIRNCK